MRVTYCIRCNPTAWSSVLDREHGAFVLWLFHLEIAVPVHGAQRGTIGRRDTL